MNGREIPGFYYDKEKQKYFAIRTNGAAAPTAAYSSSDVKRRKIKDMREDEFAKYAVKMKSRIKRTRYSGRVMGGLLEREYGTQQMDAPKIVLEGYNYSGHAKLSLHNAHYIYILPDNDMLLAYEDKILKSYINPGGWSQKKVFGNNSALRMNGDPGETTSLSVNEASQQIAMTWLSPVGSSGISVMAWDLLSRPRIVAGLGDAANMDVSTYTSTAAPSQSSLLFAFGASNGIITMDKNHTMSFIQPQRRWNKDVFALEFLSDNHSVLLSGNRKGILDITDLRAPNFGGEADIIKHPSSITHIRQLDTHRIIVAGLNSSLCQYDLRFRKMQTRSQPRRKLKSIENSLPTMSTLQYPAYYNTSTIQTGFDVDLESGIVVAGQEHAGGDALRWFSLYGGNELTPPESLAPLGSWDYDDDIVKCIKFAQDTPSGPKSVYAMRQMSLRRWAWCDDAEAAIP